MPLHPSSRCAPEGELLARTPSRLPGSLATEPGARLLMASLICPSPPLVTEKIHTGSLIGHCQVVTVRMAQVFKQPRIKIQPVVIQSATLGILQQLVFIQLLDRIRSITAVVVFVLVPVLVPVLVLVCKEIIG